MCGTAQPLLSSGSSSSGSGGSSGRSSRSAFSTHKMRLALLSAVRLDQKPQR